MKRRDERIVLIVIYVDELIDIAANDANIDEVKLLLKHKFEIKDLGELCYFMGIEVIRFQVGDIAIAKSVWVGYTAQIWDDRL